MGLGGMDREPRLDVRKIGAGKYSDVFKVSPPGRRGGVVMKLSYYRTRPAKLCDKLPPKGQDSIRVGAAFGKLTDAMVSRGISPHFVAVLCEADCQGLLRKLEPLLQDRAKLATTVQMRYNHVCFMEAMSGDMTKWIKQSKPSEDQIRAAVFQVLYTLAALQTVLPDFRHNDLSTNNVLIKRLRAPFEARYVTPWGTYHVDKSTDLRVLVALSDYDFTHSAVHPSLMNEKVISQNYRVTPKTNKAYDVHFFLRSVGKAADASRPQLRKFLDSLPFRPEPRIENYVSGRGVVGNSIPAMTPAKVLQHSYFDPLRSPGPPELITYSFS